MSKKGERNVAICDGVTAWNNGENHPSGAGYGVKLSIEDRDKYFTRSQKSILLEHEGKLGLVKVNVDKPSFWGAKCRELISKRIGIWFFENKIAPWKKYHPPKLFLIKTNNDTYLLKKKNIV